MGFLDKILGKKATNANGTKAPALVSSEQSAWEIANLGIKHYADRNFQAAMSQFKECFRSQDYLYFSAYAFGMCQKQLGLTPTLPSSCRGKEKEVFCTFCAFLLASYLISRGKTAAVTQKGDPATVETIIDSNKYVIEIDSVGGVWGWRHVDGKEIPFLDPIGNKQPTESDRFLTQILEKKVASLPMTLIQEGGMPAAI